MTVERVLNEVCFMVVFLERTEFELISCHRNKKGSQNSEDLA